MGKITAATAGNIVRRVREDRGISRAELSAITGVGTRTLYALEEGEGENIGLSRFLRILEALGLSLSIDVVESSMTPAPHDASGQHANIGMTKTSPSQTTDAKASAPWDNLGDIWKLDGRPTR